MIRLFRIAESEDRVLLRWSTWFCLAALLIVLPQGWLSAWAWEENLRWAYLFLIAFFFSTAMVPVAIHLAVRFQVMDMPNERKIHTLATPRLGGLAVFAATMLTLVRNFHWSNELLGLMAGAAIIFAMGVIEDSRGLSAKARLWGQLAASAVVIWSGVRISSFPAVPGRYLWEVLITAVWLIGITNAINFLDGINGLAAGLGTVCALLFVSIAWPEKQKYLAYGGSALAGACLGFIPFNWRNAKIFLGDSGATFIGFMLAGLAVMGSWTRVNPWVAWSTPVLILGIPIFDMVYTTLARIRRGDVRNFKQWIEYTGKDHFHHRLMYLGMTAPQAVGFILLVNLCLGLDALIDYHTASPLGSGLLMAQAFLIFIIIVALMLLGRDVPASGTRPG